MPILALFPNSGPDSGHIQACRLTSLLVLLLTLVAPTAALAHLMPEKTGTIHIVGNSAFVVVSIPVSAFQGIATQPDGSLAASDLLSAHASMQQQFDAHFQVRDQLLGGQSVVTWVLMPQDTQDRSTHEQTSTYVVVLNRINFSAPPHHLTLFTDFFQGAQDNRMLTLKVSRDKEIQMLVLTPGQQRFQLLPGKLTLFTTFVRTGINHILTGPDHLLFLLTILVGAATWRYWVGAVSAFTLAHSFTLTLSALGYVHIPAAIIEPSIAASIVFMALGNLIRPNSPRLHRIALIFLCGLLHGLGFASSIADMGLDTTHRILSLLGFNTGIEIGQFLFLSSLALSIFIVRRFIGLVPSGRKLAAFSIPRLASATACIFGLVMFIERVASAL
jgi:hydrogenase/urease accessory protein HupE